MPADETMFPETGAQCHFRESVYPVKPWPENCRVFQGRDICNTYEIADDGSHVTSCDIPLKKGVCLAWEKTQNKCLEFREKKVVVEKEVPGMTFVKNCIMFTVVASICIVIYFNRT